MGGLGVGGDTIGGGGGGVGVRGPGSYIHIHLLSKFVERNACVCVRACSRAMLGEMVLTFSVLMRPNAWRLVSQYPWARRAKLLIFYPNMMYVHFFGSTTLWVGFLNVSEIVLQIPAKNHINMRKLNKKIHPSRGPHTDLLSILHAPKLISNNYMYIYNYIWLDILIWLYIIIYIIIYIYNYIHIYV